MANKQTEVTVVNILFTRYYQVEGSPRLEIAPNANELVQPVSDINGVALLLLIEIRQVTLTQLIRKCYLYICIYLYLCE